MLEGALHLLCGGSVEDVLQVSRSIAATATFWLGLAKAGHCAPPLTVDFGGDVPSLSPSVGEVDGYGALCLKRGLVVV
jgi:hypothetical protein